LQLEGKIDKDVIKNIENAKKYLNKFRLQRIIQDNKSKEAKSTNRSPSYFFCINEVKVI
jgi:hypothetical protein